MGIEEELKKKQDLAKYFPEREYEDRDWKPYGKPFADLCGNCEKYYNFLHNKGLKQTPDVPVCKGHISSRFDNLTPDDFEEEEYVDFITSADPVSWALATFNWEARWYQEEMMSCTASRKVVRAGRRVGKTLCISVLALWKLATESDQVILVICPYEVQVEKIFDEILLFISRNHALSAAVKRSIKKPCRLEFNNGSRLMGFSSGSNSTAGSDKIRGQDANYIIIDEADYINEIDVDAILAILASHPDCGLWASSTPTGQHKKFYQFCVQKDLGFKEFWYISHESPSWTEDVDQFFRNSYDLTRYEHEFYATFGLQEAGVFRNDLIDLSLMNYELPTARTPGSRIGIGVDWNGQAIGTHIVVTEAVMRQDNSIAYRVLEKLVVKGVHFTQHEAVNIIAGLNDKYNPAFIYVDAGYGEVQVEMLHKMGKDNKSSGLHNKVHAYAMNSTIEIIEPTTGFKEKKNAKPFMVSMAVMQLEEGRVVLPLSEDTSIMSETMGDSGGSQGLVQQMRNFSIERISATGLPTYSQGEDHTLTAWMLCMVGFVMEFSDLRRKNSYVRSQMIGLPGEPMEKTKEGTYVRAAEMIRRLPDQAELPKNSNLGSLEVAKQQGEKLKEAFEAGKKQKIRNYFKLNRGSRRADLGTPRTMTDFRKQRGRGGRSNF